MKRYIVIPAAAVVVVTGALIVAPSFVDWNGYKEQARSQIKTLTGHDVQIHGDVSLALLPSPRVYVADVFVKDPNSSAEGDALATLGMLDIRVALLPLLSGNVVVNSVHLEEPRVRLIKNAQGRFNFMTPELDAMSSKAQEPQKRSDKGAFSVSFQNVEVKDGSFFYQDVASGKPLEITDVDLDIEAQTLNGPFKIDGEFMYGAQMVKIEAKTGAYDAAAQSTSLNLQASLGELRASYAGSATLGDAPEVQGGVVISADSLGSLLRENGVAAPEALDGKLAVSGVVTANAQKASLKNAELKLAEQTLSGSADVTLDPLGVVAGFKAAETIDLDRFIGGSSAKQKKSSDPLDLSALLPQTLNLPKLGNVRVELSAPAMVMNGQKLEDVTLAVFNTDNGFKAEIGAGNIPGGGSMAANAALRYASKAPAKTGGGEVYSSPSAVFAVKGQSRNVPLMVEAFTGVKDLPLISSAKTGLFDVSGEISQGALLLNKGVVNLDKAAYAISGGLKKQKGSDRPLLSVKVLADSVNFDTLMSQQEKGSAAPASGADPLAPLKSLNMPYDVAADITVNSAKLQGYDVEGLRVAVGLVPNALKIESVSARNFAGSSLSMEGGIGDLKNLGNINLAASVDSPNPYKLGSALKIDTASWPKNLGAVKANMKAAGSIAALDVNAVIQAMNGDVIFKGNVATPLTQPALSNVALQIKHPNPAQALKGFGIEVPPKGSLNGPLDVYTNVDMDGKVTTLRGIKASLAGSPATGELRYDASGAVPSVKGNLKFSRLVLQDAEVQKASASAPPPAGQGAVNPGGAKWSSTPIDAQWMRSMNLDFDVSADSLLYQTWDLKAPALQLVLNNGTLDVKNLKAGLFDGQIVAQGKMAAANKGQPIGINGAAKIDNINLGALVFALSGSKRIEAEGDVSLNFDVAGAGASQSAIVNSLSGKADLQGRKIIMKGFDLAALATALMDSNKPLDRMQQIVGASVSGGQTAFDTLDGAYVINGGQVNITSMNMDGPAASIVSTGGASLPRWYIDTVHTITLKNAREVEPFNVSIKGPLDNPGNTFGKGMFESLLRQKMQGKVMEKLPDLLGEDVSDKLQKFGLMPRKPQAAPVQQEEVQQPEPAAGTEVSPDAQIAPEQQPAAAQPQAQPEQRELSSPEEEAIKGLLNNLLR
ncbi:MAG: AsmA family protein [Alphaproteobacteria bacterium]|nr:AsmA family protein [Alphaproteobacteria bacterium]